MTINDSNELHRSPRRWVLRIGIIEPNESEQSPYEPSPWKIQYFADRPSKPWRRNAKQWPSSCNIQISWAHGRLANLTHGNQGWDAALVALLSFVSWAIILETVHHLRQSLALLTQDQESSLIINIFFALFSNRSLTSPFYCLLVFLSLTLYCLSVIVSFVSD